VYTPDLASRSNLAARAAPPALCAVRGRGLGAYWGAVLGCGAGAAEARGAGRPSPRDEQGASCGGCDLAAGGGSAGRGPKQDT
jgi:hypothetical protein